MEKIDRQEGEVIVSCSAQLNTRLKRQLIPDGMLHVAWLGYAGWKVALRLTSTYRLHAYMTKIADLAR